MSTPALLKVKELLAAPELPELGPGPRAGASSPAQINRAFEEGVAGSRPGGELARALVLLWHGHLEPAHVIAQEVETRDGSLVHAIMHRRESDYSNAKYWFHRAGSHPCFAEIARRVEALLNSAGVRHLREKLLPRGEWDAFAFVDACEQAARKPAGDKQTKVLREIQRIEMETVLEYLLDTQT